MSTDALERCHRSRSPHVRPLAHPSPQRGVQTPVNDAVRKRALSGGGALLTADDVAALLGVPTAWVYAQSRAGKIPTVRLGRYRRYRREAIDGWIRDLEAGTISLQ